MGYQYLYTVRPPVDRGIDPIGYALGIALDVRAAALVVYDLAIVDHTPARVCEFCDLETVSPPTTWAAVLPTRIDPAHSHPDHPLTVSESFRIMQQHMACRAVTCPLKATALSCLVRAGKIVPPVNTPRERAAARGLTFPALDAELPVPDAPGMQTLLAVLDGLTDPDADFPLVAARRSQVVWSDTTVIDDCNLLTTAAPENATYPTGSVWRSPRPEEPDVHLAISLHGIQFDFTACLSAALEFVHEQQTHHYADSVTIELDDTRSFPRLPNERLFLQP
ncbi:hypothetical protein OHA40_23360 [Nocardia sp. NBC_00508]|uniref:hypothetical protein n=1 Tax=Nocardia sp. NBC_00508 TaxID=2975992 RepID=UPI002E808ED7|nr:hypothetical protein [Nocardia sp. NBC_00508]WUD64608.1 hypothetical protein OHA40_23360 [Nocardia sp. NBC_00508]